MIFRLIGRTIGGIAKGIGGLVKTVTKPFTKVIGGVLGLVGRIPIVGGLFKCVARTFLNNPFALALAGPLGLVGGLALSAGAQFLLGKFARCVCRSPAFLNGPPCARHNVYQMFAYAQARRAFPQCYASRAQAFMPLSR